MTNLCAICKKSASQTCSACNDIYYCTREHQKQDWKVHKANCAPYKTLTDKVIGRYLVATRDIKQGEIIMKKNPLILGPKMLSTPLCLGCHKKLDVTTKLSTCTKCSWPLCGKMCENSNLHLKECQIFSKSNFKPKFLKENCKQSVYSMIVPLRALLMKQTDVNKYDNLIKCQSHLEEHMKSPVYDVLRNNLVPLFTDVFKLETDEHEILTVCSIFDTNSFEVRDVNGDINIRGLYPTVSLLAHNCKVNTKHTFHGDNFQLVLTATIPIKKGEMITTTYTQTLWSTLARRAHLKQSKLFDCCCERCKDPTEFGTYAGSIFCTKCLNGSSKLLSCNPLDQNSFWKCEKCNHQIPGKQMSSGNEALRKEIGLLDKSDPKFLEEFLLKYAKAIHPKNWHCLEVKYALSQMYGNMKGFELENLPMNLLERKIELCQELLEIGNVLEPGYSRFRGSLLYDLQAAMVVKAQKDYADETITKDEAEKILKTSIEMLEEAAKILTTEPDLKIVLQEKLRNLSKNIEE